jgi:hypothetical protein
LVNQGYSVMTVDYGDNASLQPALTGVDIVVSTVTGSAQLSLIAAARGTGVGRFIPAEFEGPPSRRTAHDAFDQGRHTALQWLDYYRNEGTMEYTALSCGILYERFSPGGLATHRLGLGTFTSEEGDYVA